MINEVQLQTGKIIFDNDADYYIDIAFSAQWDNITLTKSYIENTLLIGNINSDDTFKIGTATSELLENAIKYSNRDGIHIIISKPERSAEIELMIYNYSDRENADRLRERVDEMNESDSLEYYIFRMKESVKNKNSNAGLGLARVYHEATARITAHYSPAEELVEVKACIPV